MDQHDRDLVGAAAADYDPPADLDARVLAAIDADTAPAAARRGEARGRTRAPGMSRNRVIAGLGVAAALAAAAALTWRSDEGPTRRATAAPTALTATIDRIEHAGPDRDSGLRVEVAGAPLTPLPEVLPAGARIATDERTRAWLTLADGTGVALDRATAITLAADAPRTVSVHRGSLVATVIPVDELPAPLPPARFETATGRVEVLGTELALTAGEDFTSVRVVRGEVSVRGQRGEQATVRAGEEGTIEDSGAVTVVPATALADSVAWAERDERDDGDAQRSESSGIGQLRAFKPGESRDRDWALRLADHRVRVRIVGNVARTEITETFQNDADTVLEGVYAFPLPADARIDTLALDVPGTDDFIEGAFVDKERAARIWAGVIHNAAPRKKPQSDIVWVPGPWRDPALLEWQRGGRFELRVFPIPAGGKRTIKLAYTQTIAPRGNDRRYTYPLPHAVDGSVAADRFSLEVGLSGAEHVRARGYQPAMHSSGRSTTLTVERTGFVPSGDIVIDYRLPGPTRELRAWAFRGDVAVAPTVDAARAERGGADPAVLEAQRAVAADARPFVAMTLAPVLPRWSEERRRDYVVVVDSSQSMVGERFARASRLTASIIAQLDRRDRIAVLACDVACQAVTDGLTRPGADLATRVADRLAAIEPAGSSNPVMSLEAARALTGSGERDPWIFYVGDGMASVGPRTPASLAAASAALATEGVAINTVGIGGDADERSLAAIARAGGGHYVPYVPGVSSRSAALAVLETTYAPTLRDARLELPAGITDVAPARLPTLRAGQELIVTGRFTGAIDGEVVLRGTVGGKPFVNRYPLRALVETGAGNAFVPRLWATARIDDLELRGGAGDRTRIVALSKAFGVMSRHTSLLALESDAMFRAFGVDQARPQVTWTGEEEATGVGADGEIAYADSGVGSGYGRGPATSSRRAASDDKAASMPRPSEAATDSPLDLGEVASERRSRRRPPRGRYMRRVWDPVVSIAAHDGTSDSIRATVARFEQALFEAPDSRERHRDLVQALSYAGDLEGAYRVAAQWLERDRLDPEALIYMADVLGRQGQRTASLRLLAGVVDIAPDHVKLHERLAAAYRRADDSAAACAHEVALADIEADNVRRQGAALRCQRALGRDRDAEALLARAGDERQRAGAEKAASLPPRAEPARGQLTIDASWQGATDLDVSVITPEGTRVSWMGGRTTARAEDATRIGRERLALTRLPRGAYLVEVSRASDRDRTPVAGTLTIRAHGQTMQLPFVLAPDQHTATVGHIGVTMRARLVPM